MTNRPTLEQAKNTLIAGKYNTLTFEKVIEKLKANPTVKIIFDTKETDTDELIGRMLEISSEKDFDLKSRMIVQVYSYENYIELNKLNFSEYWFTNYKANYFPNQINNYFDDCENVTTIVLWQALWKIYRGFDFSTDKKIAVHTVNDKHFIDFMQNHGVDYIYCDYV